MPITCSAARILPFKFLPTLFSLLLIWGLFGVATGQILTREIVELSYRAAQLSGAINYPGSEPSSATVYVDEPDKAMVLQENGVCWGIFRGTTRNLADWIQNLDFTFTNRLCSPNTGQCCTVRAGFARAYEASYTAQFEQYVRSCASDCPSCKVVLTGHSQGGAAAVCGAIELDDLDPHILTFGQPGTIFGPCPPIDASKYYRFQNTVFEQSGWTRLYDMVGFLNVQDSLGHTFLIGEDLAGMPHYGNGESPPSFLLNLLTTDAHDIQKYIERFQTYLSQSTFPLQTNGWREGFACNSDSECVDWLHCVDRTCHSGLNGDPCNRDSDCDSGRCEGFASWVWSGTCEPRKDNGSWCDEDSDCLSNNCNWRWKCS